MANIQIYGNLLDAQVHFDNSSVSSKPLGSLEAIAVGGFPNRVRIKSTVPRKNGTLRVFFRRLHIDRIENKDGVELVATLGMNRTQVLAYLNAEFVKLLAEANGEYKGTWDAAANTPDLSALSFVAGDWYFVTAAGTYDSVTYAVNDQIRHNGASFDRIEDTSVKVSEIENAALSEYDQYVDPDYVGTSTGSTLKPFTTVLEAVNNSNDGESIFVKGVNVVAAQIVLPHGLSFYGAQHSEIKYSTYSSTNGNIFYYDGDYTKKFEFFNIIFKNAGGYGLQVMKGYSIAIEDCEFVNNGWNGTGLSTTLAEAGGVLGYDSSNTDLQAFYAGANASNGGAMRVEGFPLLTVIGNKVSNNLRGIRVQDCGIGGAGFITRNQSSNNIDSGIYLAVGSLGGCQNVTVTMNFSAYNANNGMLVIGGLNNKFSQNEVNGNWNAGFCAWGAGNTTLRDCGLYDNNRSSYNGIGNTGDAKASIQINEAYDFLGTNISINPAFRFIAEILDTQVHYTGLGSNTEKIGFLVTEDVGLLAANPKNIIKVDDVGFIGQDYAIDFSEVNLTNLSVSLGDNSYMNIGEKAVKSPISGDFFELPFSNHTTKINYADLSVDLTGNVVIREGVGGNRLNPYKVNDLQAVAFGTEIKVILKDSDKIQFTVPVAGCSIDGSFVNSVLNQAIIQLNNLFTNTEGFASGGGNPVNSFVLSGDDLTIGLEDGTSFTVDVTTLGVDENKFVSSGTLSGSDLVLTMSDSSSITIDATNMINGSSTFASGADWYYSYGDRANESVNNTISDLNLGIASRAPFYFGTALARGTEFRWNFNNNKAFVLGVWDGAEANAGTFNSRQQANWSTGFWRDTSGFRNGTNVTLTNTTNGNASRYVPAFGAPLAIRFLNDGNVVLMDLSGSAEVEIAKTNNALVTTSFQLQLGCDSQFVFPQFVATDSENLWDIVHDLDNSEAGILDGIEDHTVIKSGISIENGEKIMFMFDEAGNGDNFGTGYTSGSTGVSNAEDQLLNHFKYQTNEALVFTLSNANDWNMNTSAVGYFFAANLEQYRNGGGSGTVQGMFSLRFNTDGTLTIYDEDADQLVATAKSNPTVGSSVHLYHGVRGNRTYDKIPVITKQALSGGSQPDTSFAPVVANQTASVQEAGVLNFTIVDSDNIVNQYVEVDAPSWMFMNQATGVLSGTAPAFAGTSADTIVVNCKAGNAIGGTIAFTVTITVTEDTTYSNTKSLSFNGTSSYLAGNPTVMNAMDRVSNGDGNAWSLSMWFKPSSTTSTQTLFNYGKGSGTNEGAITIQQHGGNNILLTYGTTTNKLVITALSPLTIGAWNHLVVTFDGGTTGVNQADLSNYYSRFSIAVDGVVQTQYGSHINYGYTGVLNGNDTSDNIFRIGRDNNVYNNYFDGVINQVAIWNSDQSANLSAIYNGGTAQDMSLLSAAPSHLYDIETSITTITDSIGSANLTGYNFVAGNLVTDVPS